MEGRLAETTIFFVLCAEQEPLTQSEILSVPAWQTPTIYYPPL